MARTAMTADAVGAEDARIWLASVQTAHVAPSVVDAALAGFGRRLNDDPDWLLVPSVVLATLVASLPPEDPWRSLTGRMTLRDKQGGVSDVLFERGTYPVQSVGAFISLLPDGRTFGGRDSGLDLAFEDAGPHVGALTDVAASLCAFSIDGPRAVESVLRAYLAWMRGLVEPATIRSVGRIHSVDSDGHAGGVRGLPDFSRGGMGRRLLKHAVNPAVRWLLWRRSAYGICGCGGSGGMPLAVAMGECLRAAMTYRESRDPADLVIDLRDFAIPAGEYRFLTTGERNW